MKKHMKKVLALLLCALMIIPAALPAFAVDAEPEATGKLVITEVLPKTTASSADEKYNYIEILNTSDEDIDLSTYYLFRVGNYFSFL